MRISLRDMLFAFSYALDCVEKDVVGVTNNHGKRVAYVTVLMGKEYGITEMDLLKLAGAAILHDNALAETIQKVQQEMKKNNWEKKENLTPETIRNLLEKPENEKEQRQVLKKIEDSKERIWVGRHCILGEENLKYLPFKNQMKNAILYHHENVDGTGPFGKKEEEIPVFAQLIRLADMIDSVWDLGTITEEKLKNINLWVTEHQGEMFSKTCVDTWKKIVSQESLLKKMEKDLDQSLRDLFPEEKEEYTHQEIKEMATLFARIIDYKSEFTSTHSLGIADKAEKMGRYYGFSDQKTIRLYLAGALHDIGKLVIDRDILEKPAKLTDEEYRQIQNHAYVTYEILSKIDGLDDVTRWAAFHHEKLNGKGYPFGKKAEDLQFEERLLGCIDIYQALTEDRPYKKGYSHEKSVEILREMADGGFIDANIVEDIHVFFGNSPSGAHEGM